MTKDDEQVLMKYFMGVVAGDLSLLASLQERELAADSVDLLRDGCGDELLGLALSGDAAHAALELLEQGIADLPARLDESVLDRLAVEYADIYLNNSLGASPCESVWIDEDGLVMQAPMFQIREWYRSHGLAVPNWRERSDDHLVHQLQFLAWMFAEGKGERTLREAARFMDEHLLRWIGHFANRVATRCATRLYAGVVSLTAAYLEELRELIAQFVGESRPSEEEIEARMRAAADPSRQFVDQPLPTVAGSSPSW